MRYRGYNVGEARHAGQFVLARGFGLERGEIEGSVGVVGGEQCLDDIGDGERVVGVG